MKSVLPCDRSTVCDYLLHIILSILSDSSHKAGRGVPQWYERQMDVFPSFQKRLGAICQVWYDSCRWLSAPWRRHLAADGIPGRWRVHGTREEKSSAAHETCVFESETCDKPRNFWKDKGERRQMEQWQSIGTNDDRGVFGIWLREMSDLRRVSLVKDTRRICELCFFVTQGFMNRKSGDVWNMRQRNSRDAASARCRETA